MTTLDHLQLILSHAAAAVPAREASAALPVAAAGHATPVRHDLADVLIDLDARESACWLPGAWEKNAQSREQALRLGASSDLGLPVGANCVEPLYSFYLHASTAHRDEAGRPFFDMSFGAKPMGCFLPTIVTLLSAGRSNICGSLS